MNDAEIILKQVKLLITFVVVAAASLIRNKYVKLLPIFNECIIKTLIIMNHRHNLLFIIGRFFNSHATINKRLFFINLC